MCDLVAIRGNEGTMFPGGYGKLEGGGKLQFLLEAKSWWVYVVTEVGGMEPLRAPLLPECSYLPKRLMTYRYPAGANG